MHSSVSPKDEIWFLRVCHHISKAVYYSVHAAVGICYASVLIGCWQNSDSDPANSQST